MAEERQDRPAGSYRLYCATKCFQRPPPSPEKSPEPPQENHGSGVLSESKTTPQKKSGGWKAMPYILGNETFERLGTIGLVANMMVYLMREYHYTQVSAVNILNIWSGVSNFAPLVGAFVSDKYLGRFKTIAFASIFSILGMVTVTLTAWLPQLHPPKCHVQQQPYGQCRPATEAQIGVLLMGLVLLSVGSGGIRPCSIPFGVDQFDPTTEEGVKGINSYFNWYYTTFTVVILLTQTVVVYLQDSVSWVIGFGIPTVLMAGSLVLFLLGTKIYVYVKPEGSIFSGIAQVFVAVYKKRHLKLPDEDGDANVNGVYYDPPLKGTTVLSKLPFTNQFRFLNKAAMIVDNELKPDGTPINHWRLCTIQQVEEVKCLIRIIPVWASGIISLISMTQQGTFTVSQAMKMDRHLGPKFQIPPASVGVISMITIGIWLPIYDRLIVPALRKITKHEGGITLLQRMGIGIIFSILSMIVAGLVEKERRAAANSNPNPLGIAPMSVMWLAPQLILMGFCEAFNIIGQIEFFNSQFPDHMRSIANSILSISFAVASYLNTLVVAIVHGVTGSHDHPDWLTNNINAGRVDYFYYLIAGMGVLNSIYFLYCAKRYRYKGRVELDNKPYPDLELDPIKP
ncbi:hypothetical protein ACOSQ2_018464 [Xanthoceras sorbifolium]|uniref:Uncharacterized protein n=1 Tax=Xanthoceras sorbifolium TaxID=99658 RepID=A0ABQ8I0L6_9ROSI|nr:hypothetical protein JRO89_XS05G0061500 [Xanthoceras sorbifolium]